MSHLSKRIAEDIGERLTHGIGGSPAPSAPPQRLADDDYAPQLVQV